jgi:hypothetical protein
MKYLIFLLVIFILGIVGCKNRNDEQNSFLDDFQIEEILGDTDSTLYITSNMELEIVPNVIHDLRSVMYVNLRSGIKGYAEPSENSSVIRTLLHGQRIVIDERTEQLYTIDGITNYWYRTNFWDEARAWSFADRFWLFGAYLSENLPIDVYTFLGKWHYRDDAVSEWDCEFITHYNFYTDGSYRRDGRMHILNIGTWIIDGNIITIQSHSHGGFEWNEEYEILNLQILIIDSNNINLLWFDGNISELVRCNTAWIKN